MDNALARRHPIQFTGRYLLFRAQAVAVIHHPVKQPRDRRESDMRMRPHVLPLPGLHGDGAKLVKENKRPHHLPLGRRQRAAHFKAPDVTYPRNDDDRQRVRSNGIARQRIGNVG
jgi:hypothetical protein